MNQCPCESGKEYDTCCGPLISGTQSAATAEALMRSRYTAFAINNIEYLKQSLHPETRADYDPVATKRWADKSEWIKLDIINTTAGKQNDSEGIVEFKATYRQKGVNKVHHEEGHFQRQNGNWFYLDGKMVTPGTLRNEGNKVGRNDPCPCGSGKKYKKCCA